MIKKAIFLWNLTVLLKRNIKLIYYRSKNYLSFGLKIKFLKNTIYRFEENVKVTILNFLINFDSIKLLGFIFS